MTIKKALLEMMGDENPDLDPAADKCVMPPVELILTGTLWTGRQSRFTDDMGVGITERDYNAMFRFASGEADSAEQPESVGNLDDPSDDAARPARRSLRGAPRRSRPPSSRTTSTSAEPCGRPAAGRAPAGQANFDASQYVIDGGVLLNKPLRPALEAIYKQTAQNQVRRVLGYVVPDPGEAAPRRTPTTVPSGVPGQPPVPVATDVLLGVLTRLTSTDSVSRELAEIRDTNASVRGHRARSGSPRRDHGHRRARTMAETFWPGYLDERIDQAASSIARLDRGEPAARAGGVERAGAHRGLLAGRVGPTASSSCRTASLDDALHATGGAWAWGQTTLVRLADMTMDLLKRAVMLAPVNDPQTQGVARQGACRPARDARRHRCVLARSRPVLDGRGAPRYAAAAQAVARPGRRRAGRSAPAARPTSRISIPGSPSWSRSWDGAFGGDDGTARRGEQYKGAMTLPSGLLGVRAAIDAIVRAPNPNADPTGTEVEQLTALDRWLLPADRRRR